MTICSATKTSFHSCFLFVFLVAALAGCRKNEDTIGADFLGKRNVFDLANGIDTTTIITYNARHDSIATYRFGASLSYFLLGQINDPEIGITKASLVSQFGLPQNQFSFGANPIIDSVVFQVALINSTTFAYGNQETEQAFCAFELQEDLRSDSIYFSNRKYKFNPSSLLGNWVGKVKDLNDSVRLANVTLPKHIRIKITSTEFINKLIDANATNKFADEATFKSLFKGIVIKPVTVASIPGEGALTYVDLKSSLTNMVVYYNGSLKAEFPVRSLDVKTNEYEHEFNPGIQLYPVMNGQHQNTTHLQPAGGIKTRILFPHLFDYVKNNQIAISGAEITFSLKPGSNTAPYTEPGELRLLSCDSLGRNDFIIDQNLGAVYYGGKFDAATGEYRFNIIRHIQNVLNEYKMYNRNINYGLNLIVPADNPLLANRAILDNNSIGRKVKLKLTYTVIK